VIPATPHIEAALNALPHNEAEEVKVRGSQVRRNYLDLQTLLRRALTLAKLIEGNEK
jgi:hypothetical protein